MDRALGRIGKGISALLAKRRDRLRTAVVEALEGAGFADGEHRTG